jgi:peptidoglycan/xylan/chitin deacetylase (PgdA/CDA1 family)
MAGNRQRVLRAVTASILVLTLSACAAPTRSAARPVAVNPGSALSLRTGPLRARPLRPATAPTPVPPGQPASVPVYYFLSPAGRHVYITIDDGWFPDPGVLALMQRTHVPLTAFLIEDAVILHLAFWRRFVALGGLVEDHTLSHPLLTTLAWPAVVNQWRGPLQAYSRWLGQHPVVGRPPYGATDAAVTRAAAAAGLRALVMWSAVMEPGGLVTWNHGPPEPGEVILLHWDPGLTLELTRLLALLARAHLVPALVTTGLPQFTP